jgi:ribosomal protein L13E
MDVTMEYMGNGFYFGTFGQMGLTVEFSRKMGLTVEPWGK